MPQIMIEPNGIVGGLRARRAGQDTRDADHPGGASGQKSRSRTCSIV
jgi:hypothetical protein